MKHFLRRRRASEHGFTLIELLVVLAIIGLLTGIIAPQVVGHLRRARVEAAHVQIENFTSALDLYFLDMGSYPSEEEGLKALIERPKGEPTWGGPYLRQTAQLEDPWGNPYVYRNPGEHGDYDLISLGADGKEGGVGQNQDIGNWREDEK